MIKIVFCIADSSNTLELVHAHYYHLRIIRMYILELVWLLPTLERWAPSRQPSYPYDDRGTTEISSHKLCTHHNLARDTIDVMTPVGLRPAPPSLVTSSDGRPHLSDMQPSQRAPTEWERSRFSPGRRRRACLLSISKEQRGRQQLRYQILRMKGTFQLP